ncbi:hypothetical protein THAOC_09653, partial [Thalassiosira oceanica]
MRKHCQDGLCDVFMLDMMKRQQNSADWPYCGPVLITGENKAVCGCEAIVISEDSESYIFVMNSLYDMSGVSQKCPSYSTWKQFECTDDEVTELKSMLGSTTLHKFLACPPAIERILKAREEAQETVPWPINGAHMILVGAYFDCNVPSVATRYGSDPRIDNVLNNIIAVSFLKLGGCELFKDLGGEKTFYL